MEGKSVSESNIEKIRESVVYSVSRFFPGEEDFSRDGIDIQKILKFSFEEELGIDSIDLVDIIVDVENELGIERIEILGKLSKIKTVNDLCEFINIFVESTGKKL